MNPSAAEPRTGRWGPILYTFTAVFVAILLVGALVVPPILRFTERVYLDLVNDVNQRQARSMTAFLEARLAAGVDRDQLIREFQEATADSDMDRGYVCLIEQEGARYLSHPDLELLGMDVKPGAIFSPADGPETELPWSSFLERGETAGGRLSYGPQMARESVYFTSVEGTGWTISTHENLSRIETELARLRRALVTGALLLSLLIAVSASAAARGVHRRREAQLERQGLLERRLLEEETARKSLELEQARQLQLSLLPAELPATATARLAARMETATEVGGDFYDALDQGDGSLLLAIGDATGHGLQSGMVVVAVKSLLAHSASERELPGVVSRMARALRGMRLGRLHMAFALARLEGRTLEVVGAGMPPAWIHRSATDQVDELPLSGVPLGAPVDFPYALQQAELEPGDTVLFLSDGFPELRRGAEELGYAGAQQLFHEVAREASSPEQVVERLATRMKSWRDGEELVDDVTVVALQVS